MASNKKYWKSVQELENDAVVQNLAGKEFVEEIVFAC